MPKDENAFVSCLKPYYFNDAAKMIVIPVTMTAYSVSVEKVSVIEGVHSVRGLK